MKRRSLKVWVAGIALVQMLAIGIDVALLWPEPRGETGRVVSQIGIGMMYTDAVNPAGARPHTDAYGDPLPEGAVTRLGTVRWRLTGNQGGRFIRLTFSPDGKLLAAVGPDGLSLWEVPTGKPVRRFPDTPPIRAAVFSPDGKSLIAECQAAPGKRPNVPFQHRKLLRSYAVSTGELLGETSIERKASPHQVRDHPLFSADGTLLATCDGSTGAQEDKPAVRVWEVATGRQRLALDMRPNLEDSFTLAAGGKAVAVLDGMSLLRVHDTATGKELGRFPWVPHPQDRFDYGPRSLALSPDGRLLVASTKYSLRVWDVAAGRLLREIEGWHGAFAFSPDGKYLVGGGREPLRLWEVASLREVRRFEAHPDWVRHLAFSADGRTLASAHAMMICLWDVATGKRLNHDTGHTGAVRSATFSPDGTLLATGATDGAAVIWDVRSGKLLRRFPGHYNEPTCLAWSPDGQTLASGDGTTGGLDSHEAQIRLWDVAGGRLLRQFTGHLHGVRRLAFSPDGKVLASAGGDARARVWDAATGERLAQIRGADGNRSVAFLRDGTLVLAEPNGRTSLWQGDGRKQLRDPRGPEAGGFTLFQTALLAGGKTAFRLESKYDQGNRTLRLRSWDVEVGAVVRTVAVPDKGRAQLHDLVLSADGGTAAYPKDFPDPTLYLWDTETGKVRGSLPASAGAGVPLAFSPDGKLLVTRGADASVLLWDVPQTRLLHLWAELAGGEEAVRALGADPAKAVPFLKERLVRAAAAESKAVRLVAALGAEQFAAREKASHELERLGPEAEFALRVALEEDPSPEVRQRAARLLALLQKPPKDNPPFDPRRVRLALVILEQAGTPEARRALEDLARGPAEAMVTRRAGLALGRVRQRDKAP
jgi:WD40 repeat protein